VHFSAANLKCLRAVPGDTLISIYQVKNFGGSVIILPQQHCNLEVMYIQMEQLNSFGVGTGTLQNIEPIRDPSQKMDRRADQKIPG
jgi:hypothetical protein